MISITENMNLGIKGYFRTEILCFNQIKVGGIDPNDPRIHNWKLKAVGERASHTMEP